MEAERLREAERLPEVTQLAAEGEPGPSPALSPFVPREVAQTWLEGCFVWPTLRLKILLK